MRACFFLYKINFDYNDFLVLNKVSHLCIFFQSSPKNPVLGKPGQIINWCGFLFNNRLFVVQQNTGADVASFFYSIQTGENISEHSILSVQQFITSCIQIFVICHNIGWHTKFSDVFKQAPWGNHLLCTYNTTDYFIDHIYQYSFCIKLKFSKNVLWQNTNNCFQNYLMVYLEGVCFMQFIEGWWSIMWICK